MIIPLSLRKKETYNPFKKTGTTSDLSLILLGSGLCNVHVRPWLYSSTSTSPMSSNEGTIKLPARITTTHSGTSSTPRQKWLIRMVIQNTTSTTNSKKWRLFIGISKERRLVSRQLLPRKLLHWEWRNQNGNRFQASCGGMILFDAHAAYPKKTHGTQSITARRDFVHPAVSVVDTHMQRLISIG